MVRFYIVPHLEGLLFFDDVQVLLDTVDQVANELLTILLSVP